MIEERFMRLAIAKTREGIAAGQSPFGACIARGDEVAALAHNGVWETTDITAHAEIRAIRAACLHLGTVDLSGCVIYSTTEPCPMCFSACHWARIDHIFFGADIADAQIAGFHELPIANEVLRELGHSPISITRGVLAEECRTLFQEWLARPGHRGY